MSKKTVAGLLAFGVWFWLAGTVWAQDPRPTPTNVGTPGGGGTEQDDDAVRGSISGYIYEDVNRDGRCVNTGVAGENPVQGIDVRFTSSDGQTVITHYSGTNGDFGLYAAGLSYWEITAMPPAGWTLTTERTVYVPVYEDSLNHENVNFCVTRGTNAVIVAPVKGTVILPESGASAAELQAQNGLIVAGVTAVVGLAFLLMGATLERRRKKL